MILETFRATTKVAPTTVALIMAARLLFAQTDVTVTVSAQAQPLSVTPASVTVITREQIELSKAANIVELFREVPFVHMSQTGATGGLSTAMIRGGEPNFTLVMVDGIPLNDPTNILGGSFDLSSLSLDNIERIEIVRGPLSSLYGSEAMSGVINIISKRGTMEQRLHLDADYGSFHSRRAEVLASGKTGVLRFSAGASYADLNEQVELDSFSLGSVALAADAQIATNSSITFTARYYSKQTSGFPENGGGPLFSILRDPKETAGNQLALGINYLQSLKEWWRFKIDFDYTNHEEDSSSPAILDSIPPDFNNSLPSIAGHTTFDRTRVRFGSQWERKDLFASISLDYKGEDGFSDSLIAESFTSTFTLDRATVGASGELGFTGKTFSVSAGIRRDDPDGFSAEWSPRFGGSYLFTKSGTRLRTTWGEGFKLPSFFALADPNVGNPLLRPEQSSGFDVGMEQQCGDFSFSVAYFHNSFRDLIDFSAEEFRLVNRSVAITQGTEFEVRFVRSALFSLAAHVAYLNADLRGTGEPLRDRPKWRGGIEGSWHPGAGTSLHANVLLVGDRFDFQIPVPEMNIAESYTTVNLGFSQDISRDLEAYIRADNLFNNDFQEFVGFPNPGFSIRAGLRYSVPLHK